MFTSHIYMWTEGTKSDEESNTISLVAFAQLLYESSRQMFVTSLSTALLLFWLVGAQLSFSSKATLFEFFLCNSCFWSCCFDASKICSPSDDWEAAARALVTRAVGYLITAAKRFSFFISQAYGKSKEGFLIYNISLATCNNTEHDYYGKYTNNHNHTVQST